MAPCEAQGPHGNCARVGHMANGGMGSEGLAMARSGRMGARSVAVVSAINHAVLATEWVARLILFLAALLVLYYAADRSPPFAVIATEPAEAQAGSHITIRAKVVREVERGCNADFSRFVFDARGVRFDLGISSASAETIARMERYSPGVLAVSFQVPPTAAPGPATLTTVITYQCNRVHNLWPIQVTADMPFTVSP